jgi:hypothetical protein
MVVIRNPFVLLVNLTVRRLKNAIIPKEKSYRLNIVWLAQNARPSWISQRTRGVVR